KIINALIDTGAESNYLHIKFIKNIEINKNIKHTIRVANGNLIRSLGSAKVSFELEGRIFVSDFIVCKSLTHDCILGTRFLKKEVKKINFNFNRIKLILKNDQDIKIANCNFMEVQDNSRYKNIFIENINDIGSCNIIKHQINLNQKNPIV